jgi:hypothetical protein
MDTSFPTLALKGTTAYKNVATTHRLFWKKMMLGGAHPALAAGAGQ